VFHSLISMFSGNIQTRRLRFVGSLFGRVNFDSDIRPTRKFYLGKSVNARFTSGYVSEDNRKVEAWSGDLGTILKVEGGSDFYISPDGKQIEWLGDECDSIKEIDNGILFGPALVIALAMQDTWSMHTSAVMAEGRVIAFLGESGQGKSTLAAFLSRKSGWQLVADDILPVTYEDPKVTAWPRFPQLKLPADAQPGLALSEKLSLSRICLLSPTDRDPKLHLLSRGETVQALLSHTAGTRLFSPELLSKHLDFCAHAAGHLAAYRLDYPHRKDALPVVQKLLEDIC